VPEAVRLVVGRRLERLGENARQALLEAAIVGHFFDFRLLTAIGGDLGEDALLDALDEAERAGLVTSAAAGNDVRSQFAHELIRQTLLTGLSALRRQRLHLRVAEAMEEVYGELPSGLAAEIARHLIEAGASADRAKASTTSTWRASAPSQRPPLRTPCAATRTRWRSSRQATESWRPRSSVASARHIAASASGESASRCGVTRSTSTRAWAASSWSAASAPSRRRRNDRRSCSARQAVGR
jgi:hypothetical protein